MIGIFDSGLGGLDLARRLMASLPGRRFIYFGDTAHGPYGEKSPEAILRYALRGVRFLAENGARRIVLACHATSAVAGEALAAASAVPVIDVVGLAAAAAVRVSPKHRIGVMGDRATILSNAYTERIRAAAPDAAVYQAPCPLIHSLIEEGWLKKPETAMIVKKYLIPLKVRKIDTLILGDTRYPLLAKTLQRKIGRRVHLVEAAADLLERLREGEPAPSPDTNPDVNSIQVQDSGPAPLEKQAEFYLSDIAPETDRRAAVFLRRRARFQQVTI